jgi:predicted enzyme related to lactoylglutathione lyase
MNERNRPEVGSVGWIDLTVPEAEEVRDFYSAVVGWKSEPVDIGATRTST